ncbi:T9SS type B sorting domain-containing protein [Portibacter marinus]|uniref:T9SS type B sorting domain-containing protein n=1 Tax=Portibacter marinus TaxID=2898660 RepID=UPI001F2D3C35|nr:gliding motility-associated C-terminal domain-containing protein [Portibacter marinus]
MNWGTPRNTVSIALLLLTFKMAAQSSNTNCANAFTIDNPLAYCSESTEFNSTNAGGSEFEANDCFAGVQNDLWFQFKATASALNVLINGDLGGTLQNPRVELLSGNCTDDFITVVTCSNKDSGADVVNLIWSALSVGQTYYIRVGGAGNNQGSFQICVNNFNPPTEPGQDAKSAALLCDKSGFVIQALTGGGDDNNEAAGTCLDVGGSVSENQSSWTTWIADNNGTLTFSIDPLNASDDIDFVLYELPNGIGDFSNRTVLRCMASSCAGPTGLNDSANDVNEQPGCFGADDNFLRALQQEEGKAYALLINNFSNTGAGISLSFGGSAEFRGPEPDFSIEINDNVLTCDKMVEIIDNSTDNLGNLINFEWDFGEGAVPQSEEGPGPFQITYNSFGQKFIVLTIISDLGCRTTEVREIAVGACCQDVQSLELEILQQQNIGCNMIDLGSVTVQASGGFPDYEYAFDGGSFAQVATFEDLPLGDYEIRIRDIKGCESSETISIIDVNPITVDAGEDASVEFLGDSIRLDGSFASDNSDVTISWMPSDPLLCSDGRQNCLNPVVVPPGTTTYTLTVSDDNGCVTSDQVTIEVLNVRPIYAANIFSPNDDGINDTFYLQGNSSTVSNILELSVFDRWGNQVFVARNIAPNDISAGWDGKFANDPAEVGVYVWQAVVALTDNSEIILKGDVTLVR